MRDPLEGAVSVLFAAFGFTEFSGVYTADDAVLERLSQSRDSGAGRIVSDLVNEVFSEAQ